MKKPPRFALWDTELTMPRYPPFLPVHYDIKRWAKALYSVAVFNQLQLNPTILNAKKLIDSSGKQTSNIELW